MVYLIFIFSIIILLVCILILYFKSSFYYESLIEIYHLVSAQIESINKDLERKKKDFERYEGKELHPLMMLYGDMVRLELYKYICLSMLDVLRGIPQINKFLKEDKR